MEKYKNSSLKLIVGVISAGVILIGIFIFSAYYFLLPEIWPGYVLKIKILSRPTLRALWKEKYFYLDHTGTSADILKLCLDDYKKVIDDEMQKESSRPEKNTDYLEWLIRISREK